MDQHFYRRSSQTPAAARPEHLPGALVAAVTAAPAVAPGLAGRRHAVPIAVWVGLAGIVVSALVDVTAHFGRAGHATHEAGHGVLELVAHVGLVASMAVILVGVVFGGIRRERGDRPALLQSARRVRNAVR